MSEGPIEVHSAEILEFMSIVRAAKDSATNVKLIEFIKDSMEESQYFVKGGIYYLEPNEESLALILQYRQVNLTPQQFLEQVRNETFDQDYTAWEELGKLMIYNPEWIYFIFGEES